MTTAHERLRQLAEEKDWRNAAETDTVEAYRQFLSQYPSGKWAKEAQLRVDNFASGAGASGAAALERDRPPRVARSAQTMRHRGRRAPGLAPKRCAATHRAGPTGSGYGVQLGAFSSAERANAEWNKIKSGAAGTLDGLEPRVVVGESAGKTIYRLQAEVRDEAQARAVCTGLTLDNTPCVPVLPPKAP